MKKQLLTSFLVTMLSLSAAGGPVLYSTGLFHPHDDPDEHFDLATLLALPESEADAVLLAQEDKQLPKTGSIPLEQTLPSPIPLLAHTDVFCSGRDGYHTYRIPAIQSAPDGSLIAFAEARKYSADDPGFAKQDIVYREDGPTAYGEVIRSTDGGKTWCAPIPIGKGSGIRLDAETDFVLLRDGTLYAALRGDRVNMHFATSPDLGLTWSPVKDLGFPGHCPHFTRLSTGEILLVHRLPLTALYFSRDEGKTWLGPYPIDETRGAYPSTVELKDGTVLVVYYEEGERSAVRARRFRLAGDRLDFLDWR